jgi:heat shock protein HtpX
VNGDDIKQLFIENGPKESTGFFSGISGLFATHPPIEKRIAILEHGL